MKTITIKQKNVAGDKILILKIKKISTGYDITVLSDLADKLEVWVDGKKVHLI